MYTRAFEGDEYGYYHRDVLSRVLAVTAEMGTTRLIAHSHPMPQARQMKTVSKRQADVMWSMTNDERESTLLAIRFPLMRGLSGYRTLIIREGAQDNFPKNMTTDELKQKLAVQGEDWPDLKILENQGFNVKGVKWSQWYVSMFNMVDRDMVDCFPRNIIEIQMDLNRNQDKALMMEQYHLIRYPAYEYFFVRKDNTALAARLYTGLARLLERGELDTLFMAHPNHRDAMALLNDNERKVHDIDNPSLSYALPYARWDLHRDAAVSALYSHAEQLNTVGDLSGQ
ncbi:hypothetical protein [Alteromonas sp. CYL-A6]|uniref:hypothetical protein n=1 Tax=Alteromonas nitratireducens TaxID=3390813 RepID=UPI0034BE0188